ncbi:hypothetical protein TNCV_3739801 [Trichonephila clavipes]|nr:hypothetical protein TNCV_3739801 [Trichonephila clavipes]
MSAKAYCAYLSLRYLRRWGTCADASGQSDAKPQELSSQTSLVLIYRPTEGMKGSVDLALPEVKTLNL